MAEIRWERSPEACEEVARFFAYTIQGDTSYISHGEIQAGLSLDGDRWAPDLEALLVEDLAGLAEKRGLAVMRDKAGSIVAAAIVLWVDGKRVRYGVIEDIAVAVHARSHGLGRGMAAFIEGEAKARGTEWLFLESGLNNKRSHAFFEGEGFAPISKVFAKRL